nr:PfkB family carbohydrate kinase [Frigoribacterium sp. CFBP 13707]
MGPGDVLVIGESLIDVVVPRHGQPRRHAGGSPLNVAAGAARLGSPVRFVTSYAQDDAGTLIDQHLVRSGVEVWSQAPVSGHTSTATAVLGLGGAASYEFDIEWDIAPVSVPGPAAVVHAGSIATHLMPGANTAFTLLMEQHEEAVVTFDPNVRLGLGTAADDVARSFERFATVSDVVKLSDEDAAALFGFSLSPEDVVTRILELGPSLVVLTRGREGALVATHADRRHTVPPLVQVVDTVGAGDSFMAALVHGIAGARSSGALDLVRMRSADHWPEGVLSRLADLATRCAAITVSRAGADLPWARDLR